MSAMIQQLYTILVLEGKSASAAVLADALDTTEGTIRARVHDLRFKYGVVIYSNRKRCPSTGKTVTVYRHGSPSASLIAAGYRFMALTR